VSALIGFVGGYLGGAENFILAGMTPPLASPGAFGVIIFNTQVNTSSFITYSTSTGVFTVVTSGTYFIQWAIGFFSPVPLSFYTLLTFNSGANLTSALNSSNVSFNGTLAIAFSTYSLTLTAGQTFSLSVGTAGNSITVADVTSSTKCSALFLGASTS